MHITAELILDELSKHFEIYAIGGLPHADSFSIPCFLTPETELEDGGVYVGRGSDLPAKCWAKCLCICVGNRPALKSMRWSGCIVYARGDGVDVLSLMNTLLDLYRTISQWEDAMASAVYAENGLEEMLRISFPLFENRITIVDYNLHALLNCKSDESSSDARTAVIERGHELPDYVIANFAESYQEYIRYREPFEYNIVIDNREYTNICINMYSGNVYMGVCSLRDDNRPLTNSDRALFKLFVQYVQSALDHQSVIGTSNVAILREMIRGMLQNYPVNKGDLTRALDRVVQQWSDSQDAPMWVCLVSKSLSQRKQLPVDYLCATIDSRLEHSITIVSEDNLVTLCLLNNEQGIERIIDALTPFMQDMGFQAGISMTFRNMLDVQTHYLQALRGLQIGSEAAANVSTVFKFDDYALSYMLENSCGEFDVDKLVPRGFLELQEINSSIDFIETLCVYLDNECNMSKAAKELFLHRSSMLLRMQKIEEHVELDTPDKRLRLRMCIRLLQEGKTATG